MEHFFLKNESGTHVVLNLKYDFMDDPVIFCLSESTRSCHTHWTLPRSLLTHSREVQSLWSSHEETKHMCRE